jgi:hypothetical protein
MTRLDDGRIHAVRRVRSSLQPGNQLLMRLLIRERKRPFTSLPHEGNIREKRSAKLVIKKRCPAHPCRVAITDAAMARIITALSSLRISRPGMFG